MRDTYQPPAKCIQVVNDLIDVYREVKVVCLNRAMQVRSEVIATKLRITAGHCLIVISNLRRLLMYLQNQPRSGLLDLFVVPGIDASDLDCFEIVDHRDMHHASAERQIVTRSY